MAIGIHILGGGGSGGVGVGNLITYWVLWALQSHWWIQATIHIPTMFKFTDFMTNNGQKA